MTGAALFVFSLFLLGVVLRLFDTDPPARTPREEPSRERAKRELEEARVRARCLGACDGRGECTSVLTREVRGRVYCHDCGRPKT